MMNRKLFLVAVLLAFCFTNSTAQSVDHKLGELIVCFKKNTDRSSWLQQYKLINGKESDCEIAKCLSHQLNAYKITFDHGRVHEQRFFEKLQNDPSIDAVQLNHFLEARKVPDDPNFQLQWQWMNLLDGITADVSATSAWDLNTGGVTVLGDSIVVAFIDNGMDANHPDLKANAWVNHGEIPNNGLDDDGNGFMDDYRGWNALSEDDNIAPVIYGGGRKDEHGTGVAGMIGAVGNNGIGITGINWNVKVMAVSLNPDLNEADMIAAYNYILRQRKLYNETNGEKGAFVVATNLSFGRDDKGPEDAPIWCAMYDSLGKVGILNCAATANSSINIDVVKDLPTSCPSNHLISVTSSNDQDQRDASAAYGLMDIDLMAPGEAVYTLDVDTGYTFQNGTSFASPLVAGAIGLLYTSGNPVLAQLAKTNPEQASFTARALILDNVDKFPELETELASGGRLNVFASLEAAEQLSDCLPVFDVEIGLTDSSAAFNWTNADSTINNDIRYRKLGHVAWQTMEDLNTNAMITDLEECTSYEVEIISNCAGAMSISSPTMIITTNSYSLDEVLITDMGLDFVALTWQGKTNADSVSISIFQKDSLFQNLITEEDSAMVASLLPCTDYRLEVFPVCGPEQVISSIEFTTLCVDCNDDLFCIPQVNRTDTDAWISDFIIAGNNVFSGMNNGYSFNPGLSPLLDRGENYDFMISRTGPNDTATYFYTIWVDMNQNSQFEEEEISFSSDTATNILDITGQIRIPYNIKPGEVRIRIRMGLQDYDACDPVNDGEIEDYCLYIIENCPRTPVLDSVNITTASIYIEWTDIEDLITYIVRQRKQGEEEWITTVDTMNFLEITGVEECDIFEIEILTVCSFDTSGYKRFNVEANCSTSSQDYSKVRSFKVYPNPFTSSFTLEQIADIVPYRLRLFNVSGQLMETYQTNWSNRGEIQNLNSLANGIYYLHIENNQGYREIIKLVKM